MNTHSDTQLLLYSARLQLEEGQQDSALAVLQTCHCEEERQQQECAYLSGWAYVARRQWDDAQRVLFPMLDEETQAWEQGFQLERERIAYFLLCLGSVASTLTLYEDASLHFASCLKLLHDRRIHLPGVRIKARYSLGTVSLLKGQPEVAIQNYTDALKLCQHYQNVDAPAQIYHGLCEAYQATGAYELAFEMGSTSLQLYQQRADRQKCASLHQALGRICFQLENYQDATKHYDESLQTAMSINDTALTTMNYALLAELRLAERRLGEAREYSQLALEHVEQLRSPFMQSKAYAALGKVVHEEALHAPNEESRLKLLEAATDYFQRAIEYLKQIGASREIADLYSLLAQTLELLGREEEALLCWRSGFEVLQEHKA
ncbi:tetratricopeptide repeat protein [Ktedonospora formicarum]|uniref:Tetratricopeptide repeat protein n=1 Tax=Ktedonospora formicarum TaxID=2778364 RepID=A0A8J3HT34_9CHLR|nr:tetratricopeptide repeat protein [Ktedonospora formicarum]GHO43472.1 hypothetical protein KSX_16350 [Ktedonospora formicarum]